MNFLPCLGITTRPIKKVIYYPFAILFTLFVGILFSCNGEPLPKPVLAFELKSFFVSSVGVAANNVTVEVEDTKPEFRITFSAGIRTQSVVAKDFKLTDSNNALIPVLVSLTGNTIVVVPAKDLVPGTVYQFTVSSKIQSLVGNQLIPSADIYTVDVGIQSQASAPSKAIISVEQMTKDSIETSWSHNGDFGKLADGSTPAVGANPPLVFQYSVDGFNYNSISKLQYVFVTNANKATLTGVQSNTNYYFRVLSISTNPDAAFDTTISDVKIVQTASAQQAPSAVTDVVRTVSTATTLDLAWTNPDFGTDAMGNFLTGADPSYYVEISPTGPAANDFTALTPTSTPYFLSDVSAFLLNTAVTINGLAIGRNYFFKIYAINSNQDTSAAYGTSRFPKNQSSAPDVHEAPTASGMPTETSIDLSIPSFNDYGLNDQGEAATAATPGRILQYAVVTDGNVGDYVYVTVDGTGVSIANALSDSDAEVVTVSGLTAGTGYQFRVVTQNANPAGITTTDGTASATITMASAFTAPAVHGAPIVSGDPTATSIDLSIPSFSDYGHNDQGGAAIAATPGRRLQYAVIIAGIRGAYVNAAVDGAGVSVSALSDSDAQIVTVSGLIANIDYQFRVVAQNANPAGITSTFGTASATITTASVARAPAAHAAPTLSGTATVTSVDLSIPAFNDYGLNGQGELATAGTPGRILQSATVTDGSAGTFGDVAVDGIGISASSVLSNGDAEVVTVSGLIAGTDYQFRVKTQNANPPTGGTTVTNGTASATITTASAATPPPVHAAPTVSGNPTDTSIDLFIPVFSNYGWDDQEDFATPVGRTLQYAVVTDGVLGTYTDVAIGGAGVSIANALLISGEQTVTVNGLTPGTSYTFWVVATNANTVEGTNVRTGTFSAVIRTTTTTATTGPTAPAVHGVPTASEISPTTSRIDLSIPAFSDYGLNDQGDPASPVGRTLQYAVVTDGSVGAYTDVAVATTVGVRISIRLSIRDALSFGVNGLTPGTGYQFRVVAQNANTVAGSNTTPGTASATIYTEPISTPPEEHGAPSLSSGSSAGATSISLSIPAFGVNQYGLNDAGSTATPAETGRILQYAVVATDGTVSDYTDAVGFGLLSTSVTATVKSLSGLTPETDYIFRVKVQSTNPIEGTHTTFGAVSETITTASSSGGSLATAPSEHRAPTVGVGAVVSGDVSISRIDLLIPSFSATDYGLDAQGNTATAADTGRILQYIETSVAGIIIGAYANVAVGTTTGVRIAGNLSDAAEETVTVRGLKLGSSYEFRVLVQNSNTAVGTNANVGIASEAILNSLAMAPDVHDAPTVSGTPTGTSIGLSIPAFSGSYGTNYLGGDGRTFPGRVLQYAEVTGGVVGTFADVSTTATTGVRVDGGNLDYSAAIEKTVSGLAASTNYQFRVLVRSLSFTTDGTASATITTASE